MTVALVQGDAIGGGFEAMLTNDVVIAERAAKFGLPEILFNLFPGMGAHSFLRRRVGERMARVLIEDGRSRSADEMRELGLVDVVCEPGEGEATLRQFVARPRAAASRTDLALKRVRQRSDLLSKARADRHRRHVGRAGARARRDRAAPDGLPRPPPGAAAGRSA